MLNCRNTISLRYFRFTLFYRTIIAILDIANQFLIDNSLNIIIITFIRVLLICVKLISQKKREKVTKTNHIR